VQSDRIATCSQRSLPHRVNKRLKKLNPVKTGDGAMGNGRALSDKGLACIGPLSLLSSMITPCIT
jgi:hypothetical protein